MVCSMDIEPEKALRIILWSLGTLCPGIPGGPHHFANVVEVFFVMSGIAVVRNEKSLAERTL